MRRGSISRRARFASDPARFTSPAAHSNDSSRAARWRYFCAADVDGQRSEQQPFSQVAQFDALPAPSLANTWDLSGDRGVQIDDAVFYLTQGHLLGTRW